MPRVPRRTAAIVALAVALAGVLATALFACRATGSSRRSEPTGAARKALAQQIDAYLRALSAVDAFSGAVLVARGDEVVLERGYGFASRETRTPNASSSRFRLGSLTRQMNVAALLALVDEGKVDLQASICAYVHGCPTSWRSLTVDALFAPPDATRPLRRSGLAPRLDAWVKAQARRGEPFPLGAGFEDLLLAHIIERVSHKTWLAYLEENVFKPAQMTSTAAYAGEGATLTARPYALAAGGRYVQAAADGLLTRPDPTTGLESTVGDVFRFQRALSQDKLSGQAAQVFFPRSGQEGWNCCWLGSRTPLGWGLFHGGHSGTPGWYSLVARYPARALTVIVVGNASGDPIAEIADDLARIALGKPYFHPAKPPTPRPVARGVLVRYVGQYEGRTFRPLRIALIRNTLVASPSWIAVSGTGGERLIALTHREFVFARRPDVHVGFRIVQNRVRGLELRFTGFQRREEWQRAYRLDRVQGAGAAPVDG